MAQPERIVVRPQPAETVAPTSAPVYHKERVRAEDEWCRQAQIAIRDLQEKVKTLQAQANG